MYARQPHRTLVAALAAASMALAGCDVADAISNATTSTATLTIWTSDSSPSPIAVSVDGNPVGVLTEYRFSSPTCGAGAAAGALSVNVTPGTHVIRAYETQANGTWGPSSVTLSGGGCMTYELLD